MVDQPPDQNPNPNQYTGSFLFVNKTAANIRYRGREEIFAVRSHCMQIARRSRRIAESSTSAPVSRASAESAPGAREEVLTSIDPKGSGDDGDDDDEDDGDDTKDAPAASSRERQRRQRRERALARMTRRRTASVAEILRRRDRDVHSTRALLGQQQAAEISQFIVPARPTTLLGNGNSDPFDAAAVPIQAFFNYLVQFWRAGYMSNFWPAHMASDPYHTVSQVIDHWIRAKVISNPAMLHGLFAGALSFTTNFLPQTAETPIFWARGVHHHGKCLELTRAQLAGLVNSEDALSMIHQTTTYSFHCQDFETCRMHHIAMKRIIDGLGGLTLLQPVVKALMILCDTVTASHGPRRPQFDVSHWAPGGWSEEAALRPFDALLQMHYDPRLYQRSDDALFLSNDPFFARLRVHLSLHREALAAEELAGVLTEQQKGRADPIYEWFSLRQHALTCYSTQLYRDLVDLETPSSPLHLQQVFQSCFCLATNYMFQFIIHSATLIGMAYTPFYHLRTRLTLLLQLLAAQTGPRLPYEEALLWMFFVGACSEESQGPSRRAATRSALALTAGPVHLVEDRWFSIYLALLVNRLGLTNWNEAQRILRRFLYREKVCDRLLQVLLAQKEDLLADLGGQQAAGIIALNVFVLSS